MKWSEFSWDMSSGDVLMGLCALPVTLPVTIKAVYDSSSLVYTDSCLCTVQASCVGQSWCGPHRAGREDSQGSEGETACPESQRQRGLGVTAQPQLG